MSKFLANEREKQTFYSVVFAFFSISILSYFTPSVTLVTAKKTKSLLRGARYAHAREQLLSLSFLIPLSSSNIDATLLHDNITVFCEP